MPQELVIGNQAYHLIATFRDGQWIAHAVRAASGDRFGMEFRGESEADVVARLTAWLAWQGEHADALAALKSAEQAFHRTLAGSAFANAIEGPTAIELQKESLDQVEAARVRLDEVRARQPL
jgi:hypothetical protein